MTLPFTDLVISLTTKYDEICDELTRLLAINAELVAVCKMQRDMLAEIGGDEDVWLSTRHTNKLLQALEASRDIIAKARGSDGT